MENFLSNARQIEFHRLKLAKKEHLTKNIFILEFAIAGNLETKYHFEAGQYVTLKYLSKGNILQNDFSITSAPFEEKISLGIKISSEESSTFDLFQESKVGDDFEVSIPRGRFTIVAKPHEFRTIIGFAGGIGITPLLSHFKNILHNEPRTRLFLFFGNKNKKEIPFKIELDLLQKKYGDRFEIQYFYSQEKVGNGLFEGRLNEKKVALIINQFLK